MCSLRMGSAKSRYSSEKLSLSVLSGGDSRKQLSGHEGRDRGQERRRGQVSEHPVMAMGAHSSVP